MSKVEYGVGIKIQKAGDGDVVPVSLVTAEQKHKVYPDEESAIKEERWIVRKYLGAIIVMIPVSNKIFYDGIQHVASGVSQKDTGLVLHGCLEIAGGLAMVYAAKDFAETAMVHHKIVTTLKNAEFEDDSMIDEEDDISPIGNI